MASGTSTRTVEHRWLVALTLALGVATIALGAVGLYQDPEFDPRQCDLAPTAHCRLGAWTRLLFAAAALLALDQSADVRPASWQFAAARITALAFAAVAAFTIVLSLSGAFSTYVGRLRIAARSYLAPRQGHTVILGLGRIALQIVRDLRSTDARARADVGPRRDVIVVEPDEHHPSLDEVRRLGAVVLTGNPREREMRRRAGLHLAREAFLAGDDDACNLDLAGDILRDVRPDTERAPHAGALARTRRLRSQREQRYRCLQCHVHAGEPELAQVLRAHDVLQTGAGDVDFHLFSVRDHAARQLLCDPVQGLARVCAPSAEEVAYYVLVGFGQMGQTVALHMARMAHFANHRRLRLTIVDDFDDPGVARARRRFLDRHPGFCPGPGFSLEEHIRRADVDGDRWTYRGARPAHEDWRFDDRHVVEYAVNAEFLDMPTEIDAPRLATRLAVRLRRHQRPRVRAAVVICFDQERRNFPTALRLREALRRLPDGQLPDPPLPIHLSLPSEDGLALLLGADNPAAEPFPLHAFARLEQSAGYGVVVRPLIEELAARMHLAYEEVRTVMDNAAPEGERPRLTVRQAVDAAAGPVDAAAVLATLPPTHRSSNEDAAAHADIKLDAIHYHHRAATPGETARTISLSPDQVELLAHMEHNRWMAERLVSGWRHGARDDQRRQRPSFRPWNHLDDHRQRAKDVSQIVALIRALNAAGRVLEPDTSRQRPTAPPTPVGVQAPEIEASAPSPPASPEAPGGTMR